MTLRSVAEKAGVAVDTARKVLRGDPTVRPYIRQRVQRVIRQTGYRPNLVARALRQSHLDLVPLSVMRLDIPYFGRLATRMSELLVDWGAEPALCLDASHLMAMCRSYATRGCIIMNHIDEDDLKELARTQRVVVVNQAVPAVDDVSRIEIDFESSYRALAEAVLARGRRRVAIVSGFYLEAGRRGWLRQKFPVVLETLAARGLAARRGSAPTPAGRTPSFARTTAPAPPPWASSRGWGSARRATSSSPAATPTSPSPACGRSAPTPSSSPPRPWRRSAP